MLNNIVNRILVVFFLIKILVGLGFIKQVVFLTERPSIIGKASSTAALRSSTVSYDF